jgi:hypothetical protein
MIMCIAFYQKLFTVAKTIGTYLRTTFNSSLLVQFAENDRTLSEYLRIRDPRTWPWHAPQGDGSRLEAEGTRQKQSNKTYRVFMPCAVRLMP